MKSDTKRIWAGVGALFLSLIVCSGAAAVYVVFAVKHFPH